MLQFNHFTSITKDVISKLTEALIPYQNHLRTVREGKGYNDLECSINVCSDTELISKVKDVWQEKKTNNLKYVIDIGIGGSNLGTKAIYDALKGYFDPYLPQQFPKMLFLDTTDPYLVAHERAFLNSLSPDQVLINAISKSGSTTETIANLELLLDSQWEQYKSRLVITTDEGSRFEARAKELGISTLPIPKLVGGRYSVFSPVGLFPLLAIGIDIEKLLEGAKEGLVQSLTPIENPAIISAITHYELYRQGVNISDTFVFLPALESMGKWYRQLMGESLGKENLLDGTKQPTGITPTVSVGSTDMHSVGQLYFGGPRNKITTFLSVAKYGLDTQLPAKLQFPMVEDIEGKKASEIMRAILGGVQGAYKKQGLPYMEFVLSDLNEFNLGMFMQIKMVEIMYIAKLLNVNAFDQPHVELYKEETRKLLHQLG